MSQEDLTIHDMRMEVYERDKFQCQYPGCQVKGFDNLQLAHKLARTKNVNYVIQFWYREYEELLTKKEASAILNHKLNLITSCAKHNQLFLIDGNRLESDRLLRRIKLSMDGVDEDMIDECLLLGNLAL